MGLTTIFLFFVFVFAATPPSEQAAHDAVCPRFSGLGGGCTVGKAPCNERWTVCENGRVVALNLDGELDDFFPDVSGFSQLRNLSFIDGFAINFVQDLSRMSNISTLRHFSVGPAMFGIPWTFSFLPANIGTAWPGLEVFILHDTVSFPKLPASINSWSKLRIFNLLRTNPDCFGSPTFQLPASLTGMTSLEQFVIWDTCIKPSQPLPQIGTKANMTLYDIRDNVPDLIHIPEFTQFNDDPLFDSLKLRDFGLQNLPLCTGTIPGTLGHATSLRSFGIVETEMAGSIPNNVFNLKKLQFLTLDGSFTGTIPSTIGGWKLLETLSLQNVKMSGSIPTEIGLLRNLDVVALTNNGATKFTGSFPAQLANLAFVNLTGIIIFDTDIGGIIPEPIIKTPPSTLEVIVLVNNDFTCTLPDWIIEILPNIDTGSCNFLNNKFCLFPKPLQEADATKCNYVIDHPLCACGECPDLLQPPQSCPDCNGVVMGSSSYDGCDICNGDSLSCIDCNGVPNGSSDYDACDVCGGHNACIDCNGNAHGLERYDQCDVCGGDGTSCLDCLSEPHGSHVYDSCDVCNGDGLTCHDCNGGTSGAFEVDLCGNCVNMTLPGYKPTCFDCLGVANGTTIRDLCGVCNGSNADCNTGEIGAGVVGRRAIIPWIIVFSGIDVVLLIACVFVRRRSSSAPPQQPQTQYRFTVRRQQQAKYQANFKLN